MKGSFVGCFFYTLDKFLCWSLFFCSFKLTLDLNVRELKHVKSQTRFAKFLYSAKKLNFLCRAKTQNLFFVRASEDIVSVNFWSSSCDFCSSCFLVS